ncbi:MAG: response regulator [Janthinobacterium lividum]
MYPDVFGPNPSDLNLASYRVLVVEDEYFLADDIARVLIQLGAEIIGPVPTRRAALGHLENDERIDACVLDINLRGEMAFPVADMLLARGVPFVFATGYDQAVVPDAYGHVPRWEKPFHSEHLVQFLYGLMREKQP